MDKEHDEAVIRETAGSRIGAEGLFWRLWRKSIALGGSNICSSRSFRLPRVESLPGKCCKRADQRPWSAIIATHRALRPPLPPCLPASSETFADERR